MMKKVVDALKLEDEGVAIEILESIPDLFSLTIEDSWGVERSFFQYAVNKSKITILEHFLKKKPDLSQQSINPMYVYLAEYVNRGRPIRNQLDIEFVKLIIESKVNFPKNSKFCNTLIIGYLCTSIENGRYEEIEALINLGLNLKETEKNANSALAAVVFRHMQTREQKLKAINFLIHHDCHFEGVYDEFDTVLSQLIREGNSWIVLYLKDQGYELNTGTIQMLYRLLCLDTPINMEILDLVLSGVQEAEYGWRDYSGMGVLTHMLDNGHFKRFSKVLADNRFIKFVESEYIELLVKSIERREVEIFDELLNIEFDLNKPMPDGRTILDFAKSTSGLTRYVKKLTKRGANITVEIVESLDDSEKTLLLLKSYLSIDQDSWSHKGLEILFKLPLDQQKVWVEYLEVVLQLTSTKPSKKFLKQAAQFLNQFGIENYRSAITQLLDEINDSKYTPGEGDYEYYSADSSNYTEETVSIAKGILWTCSLISDSSMSRTLRSFAKQMYKKVYGIGMRNAKLGNAAVLSLSLMDGEEGIKELITLRSATKYNPALVNINRIFDKLAESKGMTPDELAALSVPDYELTKIGNREVVFGDVTATLEVTRRGKTEINWQVNDKIQKTVPSTIKEAYKSEIKALKANAKDIEVAYSAHVYRLEKLYIDNRVMTISEWQEQWVTHNFLATLGRKLIWRLEAHNSIVDISIVDGIARDKDSVVIDTEQYESVKLWHPIYADASEVEHWRNWILTNEITQPFKQVFREIYRITDAELASEIHSSRFGGHILKQAQFHALVTQRGWAQTRGGGWDGGYDTEATKAIKPHDFSVRFQTEPFEEYGMSSSGIFECVQSENLYFYREGKPLALNTIDSVVLSEVLRDVDLFVSVCTIANDANWEQRTTNYWQDTSFGKLNASAETRLSVLEYLIPKLKIAKKLLLKGRYLVVKGKLRTYKIHLGSSNILMEPNDQYLCIVEVKKKDDVVLPFEGDSILSLILSKAMMLAADDKIKDSTIISQINEAVS